MMLSQALWWLCEEPRTIRCLDSIFKSMRLANVTFSLEV
jgi:hypothetical protein